MTQRFPLWRDLKRAFTAFTLVFTLALNAQPPSYTATVYKPSQSKGYYFLFTFAMFHVQQDTNVQMILDSTGHTVWYRRLFRGSDLKVQNGRITYLGHINKFFLTADSPCPTDSVWCTNGVTTDPHDFQLFPDGHYLLIGNESVEMDLSAYQMKQGKGSRHAKVLCGVIQEFDKDRKLVFEWRARDHFSFDDIAPLFMNDTLNLGWTHINSVERDLDGNLLLSVRNFNEITKVDRSTGKVMWRLGGKKNMFTFVNDTVPFLAQHDVRRVAPGRITMYDNGHGLPFSHPARAIEYELNEEARTATVVWKHHRDPLAWSERTGNVQRLPNGNTLVNWGQSKPENITFEVVDPKGQKVFGLFFEDTIGTYRAFNFPSLPWNLKRPEVKAVKQNGKWMLDAGPGHSSYTWNTGAKTRFIPLAQAGEFFVYVPESCGGFVSSVPYKVHEKHPALRRK